jgi:hypothetical protein
MTTELSFRVAEAEEAAGFARCRGDGTTQMFQSELYVPSGSGLVRLRVGDRISGNARGSSITGVRIIEQAAPPAQLVAELTQLAAALAPYKLTLPAPIERFAQRVWRFNHSQPVEAERATVRGVVRAQLAFLFGDAEHPFDDRTLIPRLVSALRDHRAPLDVVELLDDNDDITGFHILPDGPVVPFGTAGDWEQPVACYVPLIDHVNRHLAQHSAGMCWHRLIDNFVLCEPALLELLLAQRVVELPPRTRTRPW